jgi:hypothetical protein
LFKKDGHPVAAVSFQERLHWHGQRLLPQLGLPGMVAIALLVTSIPFYFSAIRPLQSNLNALKQNLEDTRNASNQGKVDHSADTPMEQLDEFYRFFPSEEDSPRWLGKMVEIAGKNGLALNHGEYAVVRDSAGQLRRFKITLPVQGTYPQIRRYLAALIAEIPNMALENVQFERKDIEDTKLQARIRLVLYLGQAS